MARLGAIGLDCGAHFSVKLRNDLAARRIAHKTMAIPGEKAIQMVRNAHGQAAQLDIAVTAVVVDQSGRMIALGRMDKARPITVEIALNKAYTAASFQQPTQRVGRRRGADLVSEFGGVEQRPHHARRRRIADRRRRQRGWRHCRRRRHRRSRSEVCRSGAGIVFVTLMGLNRLKQPITRRFKRSVLWH